MEKDPFLFWVYLASSPDGGAEAVADYLLGRLELGVKADEVKPALTLVRQCQSWMSGRPGFKALPVDLLKAAERQQKEQDKAAEEAWAKRRAAIIQRDQERRRGPVRVQLERQIRKPAAPEPEFKPQRLTAAQRMDRAWRKRRYLTVAS